MDIQMQHHRQGYRTCRDTHISAVEKRQDRSYYYITSDKAQNERHGNSISIYLFRVYIYIVVCE